MSWIQCSRYSMRYGKEIRQPVKYWNYFVLAMNCSRISTSKRARATLRPPRPKLTWLTNKPITRQFHVQVALLSWLGLNSRRVAPVILPCQSPWRCWPIRTRSGLLATRQLGAIGRPTSAWYRRRTTRARFRSGAMGARALTSSHIWSSSDCNCQKQLKPALSYLQPSVQWHHPFIQ